MPIEDPFEVGLRGWFPLVQASLFPLGSDVRLGGVMLHGPTGVGKSALAAALLQRLDSHKVGRRTIDCTALFGRRVGSAETALAGHFVALDDEAVHRPCVCVLEDIEGLCLREARGVTARRCRALFCRLLDSLAARAAAGHRHPVVFIGSCRDLARLDPSLCEPGRLELMVEVVPPDATQRANIVAHLARDMLRGDVIKDGAHARAGGLVEHVALEVARRTHGFVGADLNRLVREALVHALQQARGRKLVGATPARTSNSGAVGVEKLSSPFVTLEDFDAALQVVQPASVAAGNPAFVPQDPSAYKGIDDLGGLQDPWRALDAAVLAPLRLQASPSSFGPSSSYQVQHQIASKVEIKPATESDDSVNDTKGSISAAADAAAAAEDEAHVAAALLRLQVPSPRGVLLHGPSGTGKTALALALAKAAATFGCRFMNVACTSLVKAEVGSSERALSDAFAAARRAAPCLLLLDQVECIAGRRSEPGSGDDASSSAELAVDRLLSLLLVEIDGASTPQPGAQSSPFDVVVVATTHDLLLVEPALLRSGRLDQHVELGFLSEQGREDSLRQLLQHTPLSCDLSETSTDGSVAERDGKERRELLVSLAHESDRFSGADLERLCQEAALVAVRRCFQNGTVQEAWAQTCVSEDDFKIAMASCAPRLSE